MTKSKSTKLSSLPQKWQGANKAIKAIQVAFDMDEKIQYQIRRQALEDGVSPSDQIRHILGLPCTRRPKRPRLTVSLSQQDYELLAQKYQLDPVQQLEIKKIVVDELISFAKKNSSQESE